MAASSISFREHSNFSSEEVYSDGTAKSYLSPLDKVELSASKLLFAEDLVSYVAEDLYGIEYAETKVQKCRNQLHEALNDTVKEAVTFIKYQLCETCEVSFEIMESSYKNAEVSYSDCVNEILSNVKNKNYRTDAGLFLYYCVYFAVLASRCYTQEKPRILEYAIYSILDCIYKFDGCKWSDLQSVAEKIVIFSRHSPIYSSKCLTQRNKQTVKVRQIGVDDEFKMDSSHGSFSPEETFPMDILRPRALEVVVKNGRKLLSGNIRKRRPRKAKQKLDYSMIPLSKSDIEYILKLPKAVEAVVSLEASVLEIAFMNWEGSGEETDDDDESNTELPTKDGTKRRCPANYKKNVSLKKA